MGGLSIGEAKGALLLLYGHAPGELRSINTLQHFTFAAAISALLIQLIDTAVAAAAALHETAIEVLSLGFNCHVVNQLQMVPY